MNKWIERMIAVRRPDLELTNIPDIRTAIKSAISTVGRSAPQLIDP